MPKLIFVTLPSALVGGIIATRITDPVISLGSLVGFFTILGIAARNGIMMISHYQHLEHEEGEEFGPGLIIRGAKERLAPLRRSSQNLLRPERGQRRSTSRESASRDRPGPPCRRVAA